MRHASPTTAVDAVSVADVVAVADAAVVADSMTRALAIAHLPPTPLLLLPFLLLDLPFHQRPLLRLITVLLPLVLNFIPICIPTAREQRHVARLASLLV